MTLVYDEKKKKMVHAGDIKEVNGKKVLTKKVNFKKHYMRMFHSYGIDKQVLKHVDEVVVDDGTNIYKASAKLILEKGKEKDYGHGKQIFLNLSQWKNKGDDQLELMGL